MFFKAGNIYLKMVEKFGIPFIKIKKYQLNMNIFKLKFTR